jgi:hypothetical protein
MSLAERGKLLRAHFGRSAAETPVDGLEVGGDREVDGRGSCHAAQSLSRRLGRGGQGTVLEETPRLSALPAKMFLIRRIGGARDDRDAGSAR